MWISADQWEWWNSHRSTANPLFACNIRFIRLCVFYSGVPPSQPPFRLLFFPRFPPRELLLSKQTNPLPPDTRLGCGDLLRLSGRILSNAVASVNNRKAPEARGVTHLFRVWIICLTRHSAFQPLSWLQDSAASSFLICRPR